MKDPIVLYSPMTDRFYVTRSYRQSIEGGVLRIAVTGQKFDVTDSVLIALEHRKEKQQHERRQRRNLAKVQG